MVGQPRCCLHALTCSTSSSIHVPTVSPDFPISILYFCSHSWWLPCCYLGAKNFVVFTYVIYLFLAWPFSLSHSLFEHWLWYSLIWRDKEYVSFHMQIRITKHSCLTAVDIQVVRSWWFFDDPLKCSGTLYAAFDFLLICNVYALQRFLPSWFDVLVRYTLCSLVTPACFLTSNASVRTI